MESSLHRELKERYGESREVRLDGYRADALAPDGAWVEVQSGPLGPLRPKLQQLLADRRVCVVKPVVVERRIVRRARPDGADLSARRSPRRGSAVEVFDDLVGLARLFPHANLRIDVLAVSIDEVRVGRRRRPGYAIVDRHLREVRATRSLQTATDLWSLLPGAASMDDPFTTRELAAALGTSRDFAQRVAYCLRLAGAIEVRSKLGNSLVYRRAPDAAASPGARLPVRA